MYYLVPVPKPRMTQRDKWRKRPCVMRYRAFKDKVRALRIKVPENARVTFWLPMPASWSAKRKAAMEGQPHKVKPDIDNLCKALLDAVHANDSHVCDIALSKRWGAEPGIEIEVAA